MCKLSTKLRELVKHRLSAAVEEVFELLERTITEYEEELMSRYEAQKNRETPGRNPETPGLELSQTVVVLTPVVPVVTPEAADLTAVQSENDVPEEVQISEEPQEPPHLHILNTLVKEEPLQWSIPVVIPVVTPEPPDLTVFQTENDVPEEAQISKEPQEQPHIQILNTVAVMKEEPLQWNITQPFIKEESCNISISSSLSLPPSSPSDIKQEPHGTPATGLDFVKTEKEELKPMSVTQEPSQSNLNAAPGDSDGEGEEYLDWEYEGLMLSPQSRSEETENSSEESPPAKKLLLNMLLKTNNIEKNPNEAKSNAVLEKGKSSDETENSSDDNTDSEAKSANKDGEKSERKESAAGKILHIKEIKFVSNNVIKVLNVEVKKTDKMAAAVNDTEASTSDPRTKRNLRKRKNAGKKAEKDDSDLERKQVHVCSCCNKRFDSLVKLKAHDRTHAAVNVPCQICSKIFKGKSFLKRHMKSHQTEKSTKEKKTATEETRNKRTDTKFNTMKTLETEDTDTDQTKDSSDEN